MKLAGFRFLLFAVVLLVADVAVGFAAGASAPVEGYRVVHAYPHDGSAFTQGLVMIDGMLYEGTGLNGRSSVRAVDLATGRVLQSVKVPDRYFGEGLTDWGSNLIELTWLAHRGFVYDRFSMRLVKTFEYKGEGWGLTHDRQNLIMSDGTPVLRFLDPVTFKVVRTLAVSDGGKPVKELNELEYIHGEIYANVWQTDRIARISPVTGEVIAWIDLSGLLGNEPRDGNAVLNGIAYDQKNDRLFVTGKLWPKLFEIKLVPETSASK
ncbi:glutaminyl-peptide cyclotransferase [Edaphobacter dinghuensis]|uniref:Glutamine cyclotransferase n=1 Tax=Edaphobacter dinghuensis TaxID=1560005 RepID=A0A917HQ96_9BACT|nr:glutaminyl-peptide cyclotransferase [Edaphobacter dinghuensis]GGG85682.1 glutamine cyclotransferase [Edaphobacter dinghuensis]